MLIATLIFFSFSLTILVVWFAIRYNANRKHVLLQKKRIAELLQGETTYKNRIEELEFEKQQLFNVVSHHVRGPLNRIFALIQLMQISSGSLEKDQNEYLGKIHIMIADGLAMMRNLMDIQKLESNSIDLNYNSFNLTQLVGTLVRNYKAIAEKKDIQLHANMSPDLLAYSDQHYVNRIIDNLLSNAIKFSDGNKNVFVTVAEDGIWIRVDVRDEGPGISEEDQKSMYKKFQTLASQPTAGETSTGIGLTVAKALSEITGAQLLCVSDQHGGAVFTVRIRKEKQLPG